MYSGKESAGGEECAGSKEYAEGEDSTGGESVLEVRVSWIEECNGDEARHLVKDQLIKGDPHN